ncbi:MAG: NUDIX hydrolase [Spirochaetia bacterium]|nr:NUDIX hydrolase [Spirochaetia bacterium]
MKWKVTKSTDVLITVPFTVQEVELENSRGPMSHSFHRIVPPDWANVLPITDDNRAILIRQPRAGSMTMVLETPGGTLDPDETDPGVAAARELEEETGYVSNRITHVSSVNPNPALFSNRIHFFLAEGCHLNPDRKHFPDGSEEIDLVLVPIDDLEDMVRRDKIDHALSALGVLLCLGRLRSGK